MRYKLGAVIPTVQYGNVQPEIELEGAEGETIEDLHERASAILKKIWNQYATTPMAEKKAGGKKVHTFTGEDVMYDDDSHTYFDMQGKPLLSGSVYAKRFVKAFDRAAMLPRCAKSWGVNEEDIAAIWDLNGKVSNEYGSAIHTALELYHRFHHAGAIIQGVKKGAGDANYVLPKNPHIRNAVLKFIEKFGVDGLPEVFVSDVANGRVGQIDRLKVLDHEKKIARVQDYKSNNEMDEDKMLGYQHQLSFYAQILMAHGWTIEGLDIFHWNEEEWGHTELPVLELVP